MRLPALRKVALVVGGGLLALILLTIVWTALQARRMSPAAPVYVALGSSFAAGAGLGDLQDDSPVFCARSVNGYPSRLAERLDVSLVDMSCGGAVTRHVLEGGQLFQGPQIRAITPTTRLVTLTVGGNDIGYIGDLSLLASRRTGGLLGWFARSAWEGPKAVDDRAFDTLAAELTATLRAIRAQAPQATVVVVTYPPLLPASGTCDAVALSAADADLMRAVGDRLAEVTRTTAQAEGARVVDMHRLGAGHDACSDDPWVSGWVEAGPAPFHPNRAGADATASAIAAAMGG